MEFTITNKKDFLNELQTVLENGYAIDNQEYAIGIGCCAVPICNGLGKVIAALGTTGHWAEYADKSDRDKLIFELQKTSKQITENI